MKRFVVAGITKKKFLSQVENMPSGCWEYRTRRGFKRPVGYGSYWIGSKNIQAHRISYLIFKGEIKHGLWVLHKCDNPPCVRPAHLFLGTANDNNKDMAKKGRSSHGSRNGMSKLTESDVLEIRRLRKLGMTSVQLSKKFGVHWAHICKVSSGGPLAWERLPGNFKFKWPKLTHCRRGGHAYNAKNTYVNKLKRKICRACRAERASVGQAKRRRMLNVNIDEHKVVAKGSRKSWEIHLRPKEFAMAVVLGLARGRVVTRELLERAIYKHGRKPPAGSRALEQHLARLRRKLGATGAEIETVQCVGFRAYGIAVVGEPAK